MTGFDDYDPRDDSYKSWRLAIAIMRERCIRSGQVKPDPADPEEVRWAAEGEARHA